MEPSRVVSPSHTSVGQHHFVIRLNLLTTSLPEQGVIWDRVWPRAEGFLAARWPRNGGPRRYRERMPDP